MSDDEYADTGVPPDLDDPKDKWWPDSDPDFWVPVISRENWEALPPTVPLDPLTHPVSYVRFTCTNTNRWEYPRVVQAIQVYQKFHTFILGQRDIPYNFMIDDQGLAFEGAGWFSDVERPPELDYLKGKCLDIAYIGDFSEDDPPWEMVRAATELIKYGIKRKIIEPTFEVIPYKDIDINKKLT